ncbi:phosphatase PAP2 family protein [Jiangella aurantiaca]|uniref:phosphatase PAP2 family protein n=1 Tax=Jiangella aurantiaca TaxID=2530373 RepID=UPI0013A5C376|nr:phosphatase PAP2 family protein [Jiangella aurantiaca]
MSAGLVCAAALGLMTWQVLERGWFVAWDWDFHVYVDARQPDGITKGLLDALASLGGQRLYTLPIIAAVGLFVAYKQRSIRVLVAIASGLATVLFIGYWIKFGLSRTPPASGQDVLHGVGQAFPSGHTANATLTWFLLVVVLFGANGLKPDPVRLRLYLWVAGAGVLVTGFLMTALDYHWLSDIPGGVALGLLALMISVTVLKAPPLRWPRRRG